MVPDGWLMLGAGETVIGQTRKLVSDSSARGLYRLIGEDGEPEKRTGHDPRAAVRA
jgi:chemotaxis protein methyltransferase CheR